MDIDLGLLLYVLFACTVNKDESIVAQIYYSIYFFNFMNTKISSKVVYISFM